MFPEPPVTHGRCVRNQCYEREEWRNQDLVDKAGHTLSKSSKIPGDGQFYGGDGWISLTSPQRIASFF